MSYDFIWLARFPCPSMIGMRSTNLTRSSNDWPLARTKNWPCGRGIATIVWTAIFNIL